MSITTDQISQTVQAAVAEALGITQDEVTPEATLMDELGAESIDLLDILFRIERKLGIKVKASDISTHLRGSIDQEDFLDDHGTVTPAGLSHLVTVMPQIDADKLDGALEGRAVIRMFTVQNLTDFIASRGASTA